jgi:DNA-binding CsgD family transcriptional regulator
MTWFEIPEAARVEVGWLASLVDSIGTPGMDFAMFSAANTLTPVEEISGYLIEDNLSSIGSFGGRADSAKRTRLYSQHYHKCDPLMSSLRHERTPEKMLIRVDRRSRINDENFRYAIFDEPGFRSRVSCVRTNPEGWSMINFFLNVDEPREHTLEALVQFSVVAFPIARRHHDLPDWGRSRSKHGATEPLENRLAKRFPALTSRERSVCLLTMQGWTAHRIAIQLDVAQTTVLTYRRRAYERLGISSAAEIVAHLI